MVDMIMVKIVPLGKSVTEVMIPVGSTIEFALSKVESINTRSYTDLCRNGAPASVRDIVKNGDVITLVPPIRGGM